jgi:predicted DCC family thiol-disulfide oxidoreductase YuxK
MDDIWFIYDGECPICRIGASFYKVRQSVGRLHTVNAREDKKHPVMLEVHQANLNLDEGMVIKCRGKLYQGDAALHIMAMLGADAGSFNRINTMLFRYERFAVFCYPVMKAVRNIILKLKGIKKIENLKSSN